MKLESIMNFEEGQYVCLNPENHGFKMGGDVLARALAKVGEIKGIDTKFRSDFTQERTGRILVMWEGDYCARSYHYSNLLITNNPLSTVFEYQGRDKK